MKSYTGFRLPPNSMTLDNLERQNRGFYGFFRDIGLRKSISFKRRRHRRQRHTRLWPKCTMVPMGRVQMICDFYARKQNASRVFAIVCASVRLSVRPSVTLVSCIKTVQAGITKSSPWTAPRSLVYRDKISCHWVQGFPSNEGVKEGYPP